MTRPGPPRSRPTPGHPPVPRVVTVWFPHWPVAALVAARHVDADAPVAVVRAHRVVAVSQSGALDGVRIGMRRREAQTLCPALTVVEHDRGLDARFFEPVLRAAADLVPMVEVTEPGRLSFLASGPSRRAGGDGPLADQVHRMAVAAIGAAAGAAGCPGVGVADGRVTAALAARLAAASGSPYVVSSEATRSFLADRPVEALVPAAGLSPDLVGLLRRLGLVTLGHVAALSARDLMARFGPAGRLLHLYATGSDDTAPVTAPPPPDMAVSHAFDDPVDRLQPLVFAAKSLADGLAADLAHRGLVCTRLLVEAEADGGDRSARCWYRPSGLSAAAMVERVRWQLEGWASAGSGAGVVSLRLSPDEVRSDDGVQSGFWGGRSQADEWAGRAVARLSGLLGPDAVTVAEWRGGRDPQQSFALVPAAGTDLLERSVCPPDRSGPWPGRLPAPSPAWIHPTPVAVDVLDAHGRSVRVDGRGMVSAAPMRLVRHGSTAPITGWTGPWPVEERWWDVRSRRAARFQITVDALGVSTAHLAEVSEGRWWLIADYA